MVVADHVRAAIETHALQCYPNESCGLIVDGEYVACTNTAAHPTRDFAISGFDYASVEDKGAIQAIVHSHTDASAWPSIVDLLACQASRVPNWIIASVCGDRDEQPVVGRLHCFSPAADDLPLIGAPFVHGASDCYGVVRRYYRAALSVDLPDFPRSGKWWNDGQSSLYLDNYEAAGFMSVGRDATLHVGDVLLMSIASRRGVPNHAAVYLGEDEILHHLWNQLSRREPLPRYGTHVTHVLRHIEAVEWNR